MVKLIFYFLTAFAYQNLSDTRERPLEHTRSSTRMIAHRTLSNLTGTWEVGALGVA